MKMEEAGPNRFREFISYGRDNVWIVRVGSIKEHGGMRRLTQVMKQFQIEMEDDRTRVVDETGEVYCLDREQHLFIHGHKAYEYPFTVKGNVVLGGSSNG